MCYSSGSLIFLKKKKASYNCCVQRGFQSGMRYENAPMQYTVFVSVKKNGRFLDVIKSHSCLWMLLHDIFVGVLFLHNLPIVCHFSYERKNRVREQN